MKYFKYILMLSALLLLVGCGNESTTYEKEENDLKAIIHVEHVKNDVKEVEIGMKMNESLHDPYLQDEMYELGINPNNGKLSKSDLEILEEEFYYSFIDAFDLSPNLKSNIKLQQNGDDLAVTVRLTEKVVNGESELLETPEDSTFIDFDDQLLDSGFYRR